MERGGSEAFIGAERGAQGGGISLIPEGEVRRLPHARTVPCLSEREVRDDGSGWAPRVSDREEMSEGERRAGERREGASGAGAGRGP